jgi:hypothetical protein
VKISRTCVQTGDICSQIIRLRLVSIFVFVSNALYDVLGFIELFAFISGKMADISYLKFSHL